MNDYQIMRERDRLQIEMEHYRHLLDAVKQMQIRISPNALWIATKKDTGWHIEKRCRDRIVGLRGERWAMRKCGVDYVSSNACLGIAVEAAQEGGNL